MECFGCVIRIVFFGILGGAFTTFNGQTCRFLARLVGGETEHPPVIQFSPSDLTLKQGQRAEFKILVSSKPPVHFQWFYQGHPLPGETNQSLIVNHVQPLNQGCYQIEVSNQWGVATAPSARLAVLSPPAPPQILVQPISLSVKAGQTVEFFVVATNELPLTYQWQHNGTNMTSQTNAILTLADVRLPNAGLYRVLVMNEVETLASDTAQLVVQAGIIEPGSLDLDFNFQFKNGSEDPQIQAIARQPDDQLIVLGQFAQVNGLARNRIARLRPDGSVDESFHPQVSGGNKERIGGLGGWNTRTILNAVLIQSDGKILIGGAFTEVDGLPRMRLVRLNYDGSVDMSFDPGQAISGAWDGSASERGLVTCLACQVDGRILVGGDFDDPLSSGTYGLVRLNTNGTLDTNFSSNYPIRFQTPWAFTPGKVSAIGMQSDQNILVGGNFTSFKDEAIMGLVRLDTHGLIDPTFQANQIQSPNALRIDASSTNGFFLGGTFRANSISDGNTNGLARFFSNGLIDPTFVPAIPVVNFLVRQSNGKILVATTNGIARLNINGSLDNNFNQGAGPNGSVTCALVEPDGRIIVAGCFTHFDGIPRAGLARLFGEALLPKITAIRIKDCLCEITVRTALSRRYCLETCDTLSRSEWTTVMTFEGDETIQVLQDTNTASRSRFYRVKQVSSL